MGTRIQMTSRMVAHRKEMHRWMSVAQYRMETEWIQLSRHNDVNARCINCDSKKSTHNAIEPIWLQQASGETRAGMKETFTDIKWKTYTSHRIGWLKKLQEYNIHSNHKYTLLWCVSWTFSATEECWPLCWKSQRWAILTSEVVIWSAETSSREQISWFLEIDLDHTRWS